MKLTVWRVEQEKYLDRVSTGLGAKEFDGRWNERGIPVVYAAATVSLGVLEILAGGIPLAIVERRFVVPITFDAQAVFQPDVADLPQNWWNNPAPLETKSYGAQWAKAKQSVVLRVPSAVIDLEYNYILNPEHPDFPIQVTFGTPLSLRIDSRLRSKS